MLPIVGFPRAFLFPNLMALAACSGDDDDGGDAVDASGVNTSALELPAEVGHEIAALVVAEARLTLRWTSAFRLTVSNTGARSPESSPATAGRHRRPITVPRLWPSLALVTLAVAVGPTLAEADAGVQVGARSGVELLDESALYLGADLRLSFELSPLTVSLTFDHFFVADGETLFQVGANALYDLPIPSSFLYPYAGAGMGVTRFAFPEGSDVEDDNGMRIGLNLIGGVRFEHAGLPVARPFVQVTGTLGPIDLFTIGGGVLFELGGG